MKKQLENLEQQIAILEIRFSNDHRKLESLKYTINLAKDKIKSIDHFANICDEIVKLEERIEGYRLDGAKLLKKHKELKKHL